MKSVSYVSIGLCLVAILLFSCEKTLDIKINSTASDIVVDGQIANNELPNVTLTKGLGFFDKIDLNAIQYAEGAIVKVTDLLTTQSITLREYKIDTTLNQINYKFIFYGPDFTDANAMNFRGQINHTYRLDITYNGQTFESYTTIPATTGLDSTWLEPVKGKENEYSSFKAIYKDPDTLGNCVKLETLKRRYQKDSIPEIYYKPFQYVYDDAIFNGVNIPLTIDMGFNQFASYEPNDFQYLGYLKKGDTATVKWSAIDKQVYKFFETLSFSANSVGNPFATPVKVQGNVKGALGAWVGYNILYYTLIDSL